MPSLFLLDKNIVIASLKGRPEVRMRLESLPMSAIRLSSIVLGELEFGAEKSAYSERNRSRLAILAERLPLVGIDCETTRHYVRIRAALEAQGTSIGATIRGSQRKPSPSRPRLSPTMRGNFPAFPA